MHPSNTCRVAVNGSAGDYPRADAWCGDLSAAPNAECWGPSPQGCDANCYATETTQNNYLALRALDDAGGGLLYVEYQNGTLFDADVDFSRADFFELFNASDDPWMMENIYEATSASDPALVASLHERLRAWFACAGETCP